MNVHYVNCFAPHQDPDRELRTTLDKWAGKSDFHLSITDVATPEELHSHLTELDKEGLDVLLVGGHGHSSRQGFEVRGEPVRWHDLAFILRATLPKNCTFIFFSCNGGYPGISHTFGRESGPDFLFGPFIVVEAQAMCRAVEEILAWKSKGGGDAISARELVDKVNEWARVTYFSKREQKFLRVTWGERPGCRYPNEPSIEKPSGHSIKLRGWGL
jgi:hypothetical protein